MDFSRSVKVFMLRIRLIEAKSSTKKRSFLVSTRMRVSGVSGGSEKRVYGGLIEWGIVN